MKKSSSEKKYGRKKSSEKKILLETTSNHLLFNAPGHIKNGSRSPEESSAESACSQGGPPHPLESVVENQQSPSNQDSIMFGDRMS